MIHGEDTAVTYDNIYLGDVIDEVECVNKDKELKNAAPRVRLILRYL